MDGIKKQQISKLTSLTMPDVGVSLALRQQEKLLHPSREGRMKQRQVDSSASPINKKRSYDKKVPSSFEVLIEGASVYALCLLLPNVVGQIVGWYKSSWATNGIFRQLAVRACASYIFSGVHWCVRNTGTVEPISVLAPDAGISDVAIVSTLCLVMATIRLALVHFLVPNYNQPKRLEALVRCKSISLLSSAYPGSVTPRSNMEGRALQMETSALLLSIPVLPHGAPLDSEFEPKQLFHSPERSWDYDGRQNTRNTTCKTHDIGMSMDEDDDQAQNRGQSGEEDDDMSTALAVSSGLMTSSSAISLQNLLHQAAPMTPASRRVTAAEELPERIYAAPKYATACFRMMFCTFSCAIALVSFQNADFWPPAVGGHGSTKNCWDLSSVGAAVMDSDFDHHNTVLRRYYLVQLSYHFHSGAFHILAALLLWFVSSSKENKRSQAKYFGLIPSSLWSLPNLQSLFQHSFAVGIMTFTYLFSSLRRLGAIAMFSFDLSSWFLHLLQLSINAPWNKRRVSPFWIKVLHRVLVIPAFCYCRFYIFPFVIGFSALEESQDWLRQLENMLYPGIAGTVHNFFVLTFCLFMVINLVYTKRLLYHTHVKEASDRSSAKNASTNKQNN